MLAARHGGEEGDRDESQRGQGADAAGERVPLDRRGDRQGDLLAHITATKQDRDTGAIVPYKMELRVPTQNMKMSLKLDGMTVNAQIPQTAFQRSPMNGVESYNLATGKAESRGVLPAQACAEEPL